MLILNIDSEDSLKTVLKCSETFELSKTLTADYLNGCWQAVIDFPTDNEYEKALKVRGYLMLGQQSQVEKLLKQCISIKNRFVQIHLNICRSHMLFMSGDFKASIYYANKGFIQAKKYQVNELIADAGFYRALNLVELGEKYQALALYQSLRKQKKITQYRKDLLLTNEAWLLWDLGLVEPLSDLIDLVPAPHGDRIKMLLNLLNNNNIDFIFDRKYLTFPNNEKENIFLVMLEAVLLYGKDIDVVKFKDSLFYQDVSHNTDSVLIKEVVSQLEHGKKTYTLKGRDLVDSLFIEVLMTLRQDSVKAKDLYLNHLIPLLRSLKYYTPFIFTDIAAKKSLNIWESTLRRQLFAESLSVQPEILIYDKIKTVSFNSNHLSFVRSPATWKLITLFSKNTILGKEKLHYALSSGKYRSDLHDERLFKLIKRINEKFKSQFNFGLCQYNGEGQVVLTCELKEVS